MLTHKSTSNHRSHAKKCDLSNEKSERKTSIKIRKNRFHLIWSRPKNVFKSIRNYLKSMTIRINFTSGFKSFWARNKQSFKRKIMSTKEKLTTASVDDLSSMSSTTLSDSTKPLSSTASKTTNKSSETNATKQSVVVVALNFLHRFVMLSVRFILTKVYGEHGASMPSIDDLILLESATALAEKIRTRKLSAVSVMNSFIRRIKQVNSTLNCVVDDRFDDALKEAEAADEFIASGKLSVDELREKKPFLGVPISTKDCIEVKGETKTKSN